MAENKDFWRSAAIEPKRGYRWYITFDQLGDAGRSEANANGDASTWGGGALQYACKRVDKPGISVSETEHTYLNHKFYYPGRVDWSEVSVSFVDVVGSNGAADVMLSLLNNAGYSVPTAADQENSNLHTLGKHSMNAQIGDVTITQVNAAGEDIEEWILRNAFIKSVRLSGLDYGSEDMATVDISIRYDWATYSRPSTAAPEGDSTAKSDLAGKVLFGTTNTTGTSST